MLSFPTSRPQTKQVARADHNSEVKLSIMKLTLEIAQCSHIQFRETLHFRYEFDPLQYRSYNT
jgi:hypothetical protein